MDLSDENPIASCKGTVYESFLGLQIVLSGQLNSLCITLPGA